MRHPTRAHRREARRCRDTYFRSSAPYCYRREACLRPDRESQAPVNCCEGSSKALIAQQARQPCDIGRDPSRPQCLSAAFRFDERSAKLLDEGVSRRQIGKAPAIIKVTFLFNRPSMSRRKCSCFVKLNDLAAQRDIQPGAHTGGKLDDVGILSFVPHRLIATTNARHIRRRVREVWAPVKLV